MSIYYKGNEIGELYQNKSKIASACYGGAKAYIGVFKKEFPYTATIQSVTLKPGNYLLECWGGGWDNVYTNTNYIRHYGGYTYQNIEINVATTLYIVVGGSGGLYSGSPFPPPSNYNGGGTGNIKGYYGAGATHISGASGLLTEANTRNNIYIVAGGTSYGGKSTGTSGQSAGNNISSGGGLEGKPGTSILVSGGTQTTGGTGYTSGSNGVAGQGGKGYNVGGGGWFGGGAGSEGEGGGGGSGYINISKGVGQTFNRNSLSNGKLPNKPNSFTNIYDTNGYARITEILI